MELHERLSTQRTRQADTSGSVDPFAELKNRVHLAVIGELGPQLYNASRIAERLRERVLATSIEQLDQEAGLSRDDRERLAPRDRRRHPRPRAARAAARRRHASPRSWSTGPYDVWIERDGRLYQTACTLQRRVAPAPDHQQDGRPGRPAHRRVLADGRRPPARRQPRERGHPAAVAHRPARHDPQVHAEAARPRRHRRARDADRSEAVEFLERCVQRGAQHPRSRAAPAPARRRC